MEKYVEKNEKMSKFIEFFKCQWFQFFKNGKLDYSTLTKSQRSNSYIESYNRKISSFIEYYKNQWFKYFSNSMLYYSTISKSLRSNSYIENYKIKLKLSKYLFWKNK